MDQYKPARRSVIVLLVLVGGMTAAAGVLLRLEPGPVAPGRNVLPPRLTATQTSGQSALAVVGDQTPAEAAGWNAIAIHFSGASRGSAAALHTVHQQRGLEGLAYHFVIGNGQGAADGQIEVGYRWGRQVPGATASGGARTIDICLIGDGSRIPPTRAQLLQLVEVVQELQDRFRIPAEQVLLHTDPQTGRGRLFPVAWFRQQLLAEPSR